jgi:hypothetical protein
LFSKAKASFIEIYYERSKQGTAVKWLKYHCSYAFAKGMNQIELPNAPYERGQDTEDAGCFTVDLNRTLRRAMKRASEKKWRYRRFLIDLLYAKNGMPPAMEGFVTASLSDHKKSMTKDKDSCAVSGTSVSNLLRVKSELRKIVTKLFSGKQFEHCDPFPSVSSSFDSALKDGGSFADLVKEFVIPYDCIEPTGLIDDGKLVKAFQDYIDMLWTSRASEKLDVTPVAILEPLKVRIITKGLAAEYYRCVEMQKFMHTIIRHHPVFSYIGRPIDDKTFSECFGCVDDLLPDEFYVSGDYKAATDNLNPELSEYCWEQICLNTTVQWHGRTCRLYDTAYYLLGQKALTGHRIHYKDSTVDQTWGQLMGSPMSFPILCLVNAAASCAALKQPFNHRTKMRVNGDDIGFIANPRSYESWKTVTADCGLEFSLGKNYCSREFLIMNSEIRRPPQHHELFYIPSEVVGDPFGEEDFERIPIRWVNSGLWRLEGFFNQSIARHLVRKGIEAGKTKDVYWTDLGPLAAALLRGVNKKAQKPFLDIFLKNSSKILQERPIGCNLFVPKNLGGCGIPIPAECTFESLQSASLKPDTLRKVGLRAAYLATHGDRRLKIPSLDILDQGRVSAAIKKARSLGPQRIPRPVFERKIDLGLNGTQLLSRVIQEYQRQPHYQTDTSPEIRVQKDDPSWKASSLTSPVVHQARNERLNAKYYRYVRTGYGIDKKLQPMSFEKIFKFEETEMLDTLWPVTGEDRTERYLDVFERMYACGSLTELFWEAT